MHYDSVFSLLDPPFCGEKVKIVPSSGSGQHERSPDSDGGPEQVPVTVVKAIETFAAAARTRRIANICNAYETLRSSANGLRIERILPLADKVLGQSAIALVVSAYSHERCFMCTNGSVPCEACSDEDTATKTRCTRCNSTRLTPCEFCEGTGWVGDDVIPRELRRAVWSSRLKHTRNVLERYSRAYTPEALQALSRQPAGDDRRHQAIVETIRLAAKIHALARSCAVTDPEQVKHLDSTEQKVRTCLTMLSWR